MSLEVPDSMNSKAKTITVHATRNLCTPPEDDGQYEDDSHLTTRTDSTKTMHTGKDGQPKHQKTMESSDGMHSTKRTASMKRKNNRCAS
jgi:hypothetical protein